MTPQEQLLVEAAKRGLLPEKPLSAPQTLQDRSKKTFGFKDFQTRGTLLPLGRTKEGGLELAVPQAGVDIAESALLPGHVLKGGSFTPQDAARFSLDFAAPGARSVATAAKAARPSARQLIKSAPSTEQLKTKSRAFKTSASASGVTVDPDKFTDLISGMETTVRLNKLNPTLHPKSSAVFDTLSKQVGDELDVEDLLITRRLIGVAQRTIEPDLADDRRIAGMMEDALDDFVDNLSPKDVTAGDTKEVAANIRQFRTLWSRAKKSETIETIIERATITASGFENGIRQGFRALLKNERKIRGFTAEEKKLMKDIVSGTTGQKTLRLLGKLSFGTKGGSNFIGGTAGVVAGGAVGGPLGSAVSPAIGLVAQKAADRGALSLAELSRAMAATGGRRPQGLLEGLTISDLAKRLSGPVAGTAVPRDENGNPLTLKSPGVI